MSAFKTEISAEFSKDVDNCMEFRNVVFNAARDGKLQRLRIFLEHRTRDEVRTLIHAKTNDATPLTMACRNGHMNVVEYLVEKCNADFEQVGSVTFDGEKIDGAPPLWCAAAAGFLEIVQYLIKMKARVNNTTFTNSTPLRAACFDGHFDIVQYLVDHNADIEVANRHGHTCLMIACYKSHYKIVKYLLDKGADVNRKSTKGNTALHDSAESGSLEIMKLLLQHNAKMEKDSYGMTPLLAAAVTGHTFIVEYLITRPETSRFEKIDALELLGATYVDKKRDMQGAIKFWRMAMEERYCDEHNVIAKPSTPSTISAYENAVEVRTLDGLRDVMADADDMRMQALLVRERILGPAHPDTSYYIRYRGAIYADLGNFDRCIMLWMYALEMQQKMLEPLSPMTQSSLLSFAELFSFMMSDMRHRRSYGMFFHDMMIVFSKSVHELESGMAQLSKIAPSERDMGNFNRLMIIVLHLICLLCQTQPTMTAQQLQEFKTMTYKVVKVNPRTSKGYTVLHLACSKDTSTVGRYPVCSFPSPEVVSLLIDVGAQVNATDNNHNTALHVASMNRPCKVEVIKMLLDNTAHIDACNSDNKTPMQLMHNMTIYDIVAPLNFMTLQCLAARKIVQCNILYEGHIPSRLEAFVRMH